MTAYSRVRLSVYFGVAVMLLWPIWMFSQTWNEPAGAGGVLFTVLIVTIFWVIGRWDLTSYWLQYPFPVIFLAIIFKKAGWLATLAAAGMMGGLWLLVRQPTASEPSLQLSFPLRGGLFYVAHGGRLAWLNHHRVSKSQRYAIDVMQLNWLGARAAGIYPKRLEAYRIFGSPVVSPCAGLVTSVVNDLPELPPGEMDPQHPAGNHVVIRCDGSGVYVGLAHLMQGSVLVVPGQRVAIGQPLARVGNSGNTSEPHLHLHAKRGGAPESMLDGEAVPTRLDGRWLIRNDLVRSR